MFEVTLKIKHPQELKEYDMMERNNTEVLMILNKLKEELS